MCVKNSWTRFHNKNKKSVLSYLLPLHVLTATFSQLRVPLMFIARACITFPNLPSPRSTPSCNRSRGNSSSSRFNEIYVFWKRRYTGWAKDQRNNNSISFKRINENIIHNWTFKTSSKTRYFLLLPFVTLVHLSVSSRVIALGVLMVKIRIIWFIDRHRNIQIHRNISIHRYRGCPLEIDIQFFKIYGYLIGRKIGRRHTHLFSDLWFRKWLVSGVHKGWIVLDDVCFRVILVIV